MTGVRARLSPEKRDALKEHVRGMVSRLARDGYRRKISEAVEEALRLGLSDDEILALAADAVRRARRRSRRRSGLV